jgi:hypothetical protein
VAHQPLRLVPAMGDILAFGGSIGGSGLAGDVQAVVDEASRFRHKLVRDVGLDAADDCEYRGCAGMHQEQRIQKRLLLIFFHEEQKAYYSIS